MQTASCKPQNANCIGLIPFGFSEGMTQHPADPHQGTAHQKRGDAHQMPEVLLDKNSNKIKQSDAEHE